MQIAYLNGQYLPLAEARISPLDRGFLFGDGIYEVIPTYSGKPVGLNEHIERMQSGLAELAIALTHPNHYWYDIIEKLIEHNAVQLGENVGIYIQVSRGTDTARAHAYPTHLTPTVFAYAFAIPALIHPDGDITKVFRVVTQQDRRWQRCHIKSTALLGNVMHYQHGQTAGVDEVILFNQHQQVTEAAACNVFMVTDGQVVTAPLDHQILPGITRKLVIEALAEQGIKVTERAFSLNELHRADEVWLTSSTKGIGAVVEVDGKPIGVGSAGAIWAIAQRAYIEALV